MPIKLTPVQTNVYLKLKDNPNITAQDLSAKMGMTLQNIRSILTALKQKGALEISKDTWPYSHSAIDIEYTTGKAMFIKEEGVFIDPTDADKGDLIMQVVASFELTDEQWQFVQANKRMKRSQLAKKLGIGKLELATGIIKRKGTKAD